MKDIIEKFQKNKQDTGSSEVQVIQLTHKIKVISDHIKLHPKDFHCKIGLMADISQRKSLLSYLKRKKLSRYQELIKALGLRH
jgi:small subunit ribosomal protein S15